MQIYARHGDLVVNKVEAISGELKIEKNIVFAGDSSGHTHRLVGAAAIRREGRNTFVRIDKDTTLVHDKKGGHRTLPMRAGSYEIHPLREAHDGSERPVVD